MEDPVVPLERNLCDHPLIGLLWERQFEKVLLKHGWEKIPNWEFLFVHRDKGLFLSVYVDDIKLAGKKHNIDPMWKVLSICFYPSENGRCSQITENSQIGVSRHLDSSTTTQMAKIMVQYGRSSRSS